MCTAQADFDGVVRHLGDLIDVGYRLGIKEHLATGIEHVANSLMFLARFAEAEEKAWEALTISREVGDRQHEAMSLEVLAMCHLCRGDFTRARQLAEEGLQIGEKIGDLQAQVYDNWLLAALARWQGSYEEGLLYGCKSLDAALPVEGFMPWMAVQPLGVLGSIYLEISPKFTDAIAEFHRHAMCLLESPKATIGGGTVWADLGWCALSVDDLEIAADSFEKGLQGPSLFMLMERPRYLSGSALLAIRQDRHDEALALADEACAYAEEKGMRHLFPQSRFVAGLVRAARGETEQALEQFAQGEAVAAELQMRPYEWQILNASARTLELLDRSAEAAEKRQAAHAVIDEIAALFEDETLRQAFVAHARSAIEA